METKVLAIRQMEYTPAKGEINNSPSETIEGQSLTVNEILIKFSQGLLPDIVQDVYYDPDDVDYDDVDPTLSPDFDLSDTDIYKDFKNEKEAPKELKNDKSDKKKVDNDSAPEVPDEST